MTRASAALCLAALVLLIACGGGTRHWYLGVNGFRLILVLGAAVIMLACGGASDLPSSSQVFLSIAPSSATIQVGQSVDFLGTATGFTQPTLFWWEQDQHDAAVNGYGEENCDNITTANTNLIASCSYGYLTLSAIVQASSSTATYHAPMTPGTYHVTLRAVQASTQNWAAYVEKRTTATIIVTP